MTRAQHASRPRRESLSKRLGAKARRIRERDRAEKEFREIVDGAAVAVAATDSSETGQPADIPKFDV